MKSHLIFDEFMLIWKRFRRKLEMKNLEETDALHPYSFQINHSYLYLSLWTYSLRKGTSPLLSLTHIMMNVSNSLPLTYHDECFKFSQMIILLSSYNNNKYFQSLMHLVAREIFLQPIHDVFMWDPFYLIS